MLRAVSEDTLPRMLHLLKMFAIQHQQHHTAHDINTFSNDACPIEVPYLHVGFLRSGLALWKTADALLLNNGQVSVGFFSRNQPPVSQTLDE